MILRILAILFVLACAGRIARAEKRLFCLLCLGFMGIGTAHAVDYSFTEGTRSSFLNCPVYGYNVVGHTLYSTKGWTQSGTTWTCATNVTLGTGDRILPSSSITLKAEAGIALNGNNTIGSASVPVNLTTTSGNLTTTGTSRVYGNLTTSSGAVSLTGTTVNGTVTTSGTLNTSGGQITGNVSANNGVTSTNGTVFGGSVTVTNGTTSFSNGGSVAGNVTSSGNLTATGGVVFSGNVTATNGTLTLTNGGVAGAVRSNCCVVSTANTNVSNGVSSGSSTVNINGGTVSGPISTSGGSGIIISNATVSSGTIAATNVPISISNSTIGTSSSPVPVSSNNTVTITSSTVYGNVTAATWQNPITVVDSNSIVHGTCDSQTNSSNDPDSYSNRCDGGAAAAPHHLELSLPSASGLTCMPSEVTVKACADAACSTLATSSATVTLLPASGWAANPITFTGSTTASLSIASPQTVTLGTSTVSPAPSGTSPRCFVGGTESCSLAFADAGFIFSGASGGTALTIPTQVAGVDSGTYYLRAVKKNTSTQACEAGLVGASSVNFAHECIDPPTCSGENLMSVNGSSVAANGNESVINYSTVNMVFDANGNTEEPFTFNYSDVGRVKLWVNKTVNSATLTGSSNAFVVKPFGFTIVPCTVAIVGDCITPPDDPGLLGGGGVFVKAGEIFKATVTARTALGATTPSFGLGANNATEMVSLAHNLVAPTGVGATDVTLGGTTSIARSSFSNGVATVSGLAWGEVGVITLTATNSTFLGNALETTGSSENVGRFIPDHFNTVVTLASGVPMDCPAGLACPVSYNGFVYSGQPFTLNVSAMNSNNVQTQNYQGDFSKVVALSAVNAVGGAAIVTAAPGGALTAASAPATSFASGSTVAPGTPAAPVFTFATTPTVPTDVYVRALDTDDGVTSLRSVAASSVEGGVKVVNGRVMMSNAYGSELLPLSLNATVQYYNGTAWVLSSTDTEMAISAANFALAFPSGTVSNPNNLAACETVLSVTGTSPEFKVGLTAPGIGNAGWTELTLNLGTAAGQQCTAPGGAGASSTSAAYSWLQFPEAMSPKARATFGIYKGNSKFIYIREQYY